MNKELEQRYRESCQKQVDQGGSCALVKCAGCPGSSCRRPCYKNGWRNHVIRFDDKDPQQLASAKKWLDDHPEQTEAMIEIPEGFFEYKNEKRKEVLMLNNQIEELRCNQYALKSAVKKQKAKAKKARRENRLLIEENERSREIIKVLKSVLNVGDM